MNINVKEIPMQLLSRNIWAPFKSEEHNSELVEVPYSSFDETPITDISSYTVPWEAINAYKKGFFDGIGVILLPDKHNIMAIDFIDAVINGRDEMEDWAVEQVITMPSYYEKTVDGKSIRLFTKDTKPDKTQLINVGKLKMKIWGINSFVSVSGNRWLSASKDLIDMNKYREQIKTIKSRKR